MLHFETVPNSKDQQMITKIWLLKDFPKAFIFSVLKCVYIEERVNSFSKGEFFSIKTENIVGNEENAIIQAALGFNAIKQLRSYHGGR